MLPYLSIDSFNKDIHLIVPEWLFLKSGPVRDHAVVVSKNLFIAVGMVSTIKSEFPDLVPTDLPGTLLMPGFIDTHHHLTSAFGKALVFGEPSEIWRRVWVPLERHLDEEHLYLASKLASLEALRGGFTTVCEAGTRGTLGVDAIARATTETGIKCVLGLICNDLDGNKTPQNSDLIIDRALKHILKWHSHNLVYPSLSVSIPEAATNGILAKISAICAESDCIFQTHVNEHLSTVERSLELLNMRPIEHLYSIGALGPQTILAHATLVTPTELKMICDTGSAVSYNPVASAWKGNAVAPALLMMALGIRLGIGTDGTRSDGFRLMDYAEAAQRFVFGIPVGDSSCGGGWTWVDHATAHGADVLKLGQTTGEIAVGKDADFLLIDLQVPEMLPSWDISWELVRLANRDQIIGVFVSGKLRLWKGWPTDWDARSLMAQISASAKKIVSQAPIIKIHKTRN